MWLWHAVGRSAACWGAGGVLLASQWPQEHMLSRLATVQPVAKWSGHGASKA